MLAYHKPASNLFLIYLRVETFNPNWALVKKYAGKIFRKKKRKANLIFNGGAYFELRHWETFESSFRKMAHNLVKFQRMVSLA